MASRLPEPTAVKDKPTQSYLLELVKTLRNTVTDLTADKNALQTQIDTINEILARHHIT